MKIIKGKYSILIDREDFKKINGLKFYVANPNKKYSYRRVRLTNGTSLGKYLLGVKTDDQIDHINGNPLDNRKKNLRVCTKKQNLFNKRIYSNNTSGYKGVYFSSNKKLWITEIHAHKKRYRKSSKSKIAAALAYNELAKIHHGEFAVLNIIK